MGAALNPPAIRRLAWFAIAGQAVFVAAWILAAALAPSYSNVEQSISELAGSFAEDPWIVRAAFVILGLSLLALAAALLRVLPPVASARVAAGLFALCGIALATAGLLPIECSFGLDETCDERFEAGALDWQTEAHGWAGLLSEVAILGTPFALALALRSRPVAPLLVGAGLFGIVIGVGAFLLGANDAPGAGVTSRIEFLILHAWVILVAVGILDAVAPEPAPERVSNVSPRDFLGRSWRGEGEIVYRPALVWRPVRQRFVAERESRWLSETVLLVTDRASYTDGWIYEQRRVCQLERPDRLRVTAGDLPDGAVFELYEDGYRLHPYRLISPLGPIGVILRCEDRHTIAADGTLIDTIDARVLGIRVARIQVRARPLGA